MFFSPQACKDVNNSKHSHLHSEDSEQDVVQEGVALLPAPTTATCDIKKVLTIFIHKLSLAFTPASNLRHKKHFLRMINDKNRQKLFFSPSPLIQKTSHFLLSFFICDFFSNVKKERKNAEHKKSQEAFLFFAEEKINKRKKKLNKNNREKSF